MNVDMLFSVRRGDECKNVSIALYLIPREKPNKSALHTLIICVSNSRAKAISNLKEDPPPKKSTV